MINTLIKDLDVLVYQASDPALLWPCSLSAKYSEKFEQAIISLHSLLPIHGFDHEQAFVLSYEPNNLVPGENSLKPAKNTHISRDQLADLERDGNPRWNILSLTLKEHCAVWYPPTCKTIKPKLGHEPRFCQFVKLARAKNVHVLFDYNWVHADKVAQFENIINHPDSLTGLRPDKRNAKRYKRADCSVFSPVEDTVLEAPPPYTATPCKRSKDVLSSSPLGSPSPKRVHVSPAPISGPAAFEKATTALIPGSKPISSPLINAPNFREAIKDATPSLSQSSSDLHPTHISSPYTRLKADLVSFAETKFQEIFARAYEDAEDLRDTADIRFNEELEDQRIDMVTFKEETMAELNYAFDDNLYKFNESIANTVQEMRETADEVLIDLRERLHDLVGSDGSLGMGSDELRKIENELRGERKELRRERRELRMERGELRRERGDLRREWGELERMRQGLRVETEELRREREDLRKKSEELSRIEADLNRRGGEIQSSGKLQEA